MSVYWTNEVKKIMDNKIHELMDKMLDDQDANIETLKHIRICRMFANEIISDMEEKDRKDEQAAKDAEAKRNAEEEARKAAEDDAAGST